MNNRLQEAIRVQKIRSFHKKALQEARSLNEETLWKTFVEPFTDVLDAAKLTSQDILSAAKFSLDMIFGFSPQAIEQATQNYDKRHEELQKKWEPILDRNREALQGDADIIAFALAPHLYITSEVAMRGIDKFKDINDYMQESGMGNVFRGITYGSAGLALGGPVGAAAAVALAYGKNKSVKFKSEKEYNEKTKEYSPLQKLAGLFYIGDAWKRDIKPEGVTQQKSLLREQEKENNNKDMRAQYLDYLQKIGFMDSIESDANEVLKIQEDYIDSIVQEAEPKLKLIKDLAQSTDIATFTSIIDNAKNNGLDLKAAGLEKVKSQIEQSVQKLAQSEEFRKELLEKKKGSPNKSSEPNKEKIPELSDDEVRKAAEKVAFINAKQNFDKEMAEGSKQLKDTALKLISEKTPSEESLRIVKQSPAGIKLVKLLDDAKQKIASL